MCVTIVGGACGGILICCPNGFEATAREKEDRAEALAAAKAKEIEAARRAKVRFDQANAAATHRKVLADIATQQAPSSPLPPGQAPEPFPPIGANTVPAALGQPANGPVDPLDTITVQPDPLQAMAPPLAPPMPTTGNPATPPQMAMAVQPPTCTTQVPNRFGTPTCVRAFIGAMTAPRRS